MGKTWVEEFGPEFKLTGFLKGFAKLLIRPPVVAYFLLALTADYWNPYAIYFLLRTWLLGCGTLFMWIVLVVGAAAFVGGFGHVLRYGFTIQPFAKAWRAAKKSGDAEAAARALEAWRARRNGFRLWPLFVAMLSVFVIRPSGVAVVLSSAEQPALEKEHGRLRFMTRDEQMRSLIRFVERRGPPEVFRREGS